MNKILNKLFDIINFKQIKKVEELIKEAMTKELDFGYINMDKEDQNYALTIRNIYYIIYYVAKKLNKGDKGIK
jgi:6-pyruvoyl-tetrahydropterin synthase